MRQRTVRSTSGAVLARDAQGEVLLRFEVRGEAKDVEDFGAVQFEGLRGGAFLELQREHAHADEVGTVDAFEALGDDGFDAEQAVPLAAQSRDCRCRIPGRRRR